MTKVIKSHVKLPVKSDAQIQDELLKLVTGGQDYFLSRTETEQLANLLHRNSD